MKTPSCLPTLVSAVALALGLVAVLPGPVPAADIPGAGIPDRIDGTRQPDTSRGPAQPQGTPPNENYRANYFVDYHVNTGDTATRGAEGSQDSPANIRDSIGRRDTNTAGQRDPFAREMSRFRGEMSNWRR